MAVRAFIQVTCTLSVCDLYKLHEIAVRRILQPRRVEASPSHPPEKEVITPRTDVAGEENGAPAGAQLGARVAVRRRAKVVAEGRQWHSQQPPRRTRSP